MARLFLYAPRDFRNLCALARTMEVFGVDDCFVFDPHRLIRERYGKSRMRQMRDVSSGAFDKIRWQRVDEPLQFLASYPGRAVATVAQPNAPSLTEHRFAATDLLLFGSENSGLPDDVVGACSATMTVPAHGETQSLNLAVAFGIVLFECQRQSKA